MISGGGDGGFEGGGGEGGGGEGDGGGGEGEGGGGEGDIVHLSNSIVCEPVGSVCA